MLLSSEGEDGGVGAGILGRSLSGTGGPQLTSGLHGQPKPQYRVTSNPIAARRGGPKQGGVAKEV